MSANRSASGRLCGYLSALCFSGLLLIAPAVTAADAPGAIIHPRLIWTAEPQSRALVCWDTATEGKEHIVYYDTKSRKAVIGQYAGKKASTTNGAYTFEKKGENPPPDVYFHHVQLTDLTPGTTYYFVMASDGAVSKEFHFKTAPAGDEPLKIIFGGDSRSGMSHRKKINALIAKTAEKDGSILALAHGGDYVINGMNFPKWQMWLKDQELTITTTGRMIPLIPARGNHEGRGPLYDQVLGFPGGEGKNYFATRLSSEVLFVTLNTETGAAGAQKAFLEEALSKAEDIRWRTVQYHRPVYPAVKEAGKGLEHWVPLFEKYDVALACEADGHCIKRTVPIRNGKQDPTGVVYIGEGGLGVGQREPKTDRWYVQAPGMVGQGHHFQLLSFAKEGLTIDVIGIDGTMIDTHKIAARALAGAK